MADDNITVKLDLKGARQFARDAARSAAGIDAIAAAAKRANGYVRQLSQGMNQLGRNTRDYGRAAREAERAASSLQRQVERLRRELDRAQNSQRRLGNQTRTSTNHISGFGRAASLGSRALGAITQTAAAAAVAIGAAGIAAVGFGLKTFAANENAAISFEVMMKSAEKANVFIERMKQFAFNTPFSVQEVQTASQQLMAFGFQADKILNQSGKGGLLEDIGNAAAAFAGVPGAFGRITYAIGQLKSTPFVQGDEIRQLQELGIPAYAILSKATGKRLGPDNLATSKVNSQGAIAALQKYFQANYGGLMERQSKTLGGMWNNFKERLTQASAEGVTPLAEALKRILPGAANVAEAAVSGLGKGLGWLITQGAKLGPTFKELRTAFKFGGVDEVINQLDQKLNMKGKLNEFWSTLKMLGVQTYNFVFKTVWPIVKMLLPTVIQVVTLVGRAITYALVTVNTLGPVIKTALWPVKKFVEMTLDSVKALFDFLEKIGGWLGGTNKNPKTNPLIQPRQLGGSPNPFGGSAPGGFPGTAPRAATGGTVYRAGRVRVGEGGPEWLNLPKGANVQPNSQVMKNDNSQSGAVIIQPGGIQINGVTNAEGKRLAKIVVDEIKNQVARA